MKQKDIAKTLNTSISTVSRVLGRSDTRSISEELKQQIITMAFKNGIKVKTKKYGILVGSYHNKLDDPFYGDIIRHASRAFQDMSYYRSFHCTAPELDKISEAELLDCYGKLDGAVIITMAPGRIINKISTLTDNIVYIGEIFAYNEVMKLDYDLPDFSYDRITYDSYNMIAQCVEYLAGLGRKKIIFIGIEEEHKDRHVRLAGFKYGLTKTGLENEGKIYYASNISFDGGYFIAGEIFKNEKFDAVICHNDEIALGLMERLKSLGMKIPEDVMVTGFYDMPAAAASDPPLTTVRVDTKGIGYLSARIINAHVDGIIKAPVSVKVELELVKRASTGEAVPG